MAYKEESDQQFMESIVNQARGPVRRPMGGQQYNGDPGFGPDDDSFGNERSPMKRSNGFQNIDGADQYDSDQAVTNFANKYEPTELGTRPMNTAGEEEQENPRAEMQELKRAIQEKERELHELQQQKVKLMRKITGRLE